MKPLLTLLILSCLVFSSCTATKILTSDVSPAEISDLRLMEPNSYISMIKKGNRGEVDEKIFKGYFWDRKD